MATTEVWPGSGSTPEGKTPFAFYDDDDRFVEDAPKVAVWCARRLGYPAMDVELIDYHFYACFEEAITEYGHQVNQFNIRENLFNLRGRPRTENLTGANVISTPLPFLARLASDYGTEVGAGGNVDLKTGFIYTSESIQEYDLQSLWADVSESGNRLEIRKVFHKQLPAIQRIYGNYGGLGSAGAGLTLPGTSGADMTQLLSEFGWDSMSPAINYILLPAYEDILRVQAIEFNDTIRRSAFTFEIANNKLRVFPIPRDSFVLFFQYTVLEERLGSGSAFPTDEVSDYSNTPYQNVVYTDINDVGRQWIYQYTLACAKDTLGLIRSKYQTIPIPNGEVTLDGTLLRQEAAEEKQKLIELLRESLDESGQAKQFEKQKANAENMNEIYKRVPTYIYVG